MAEAENILYWYPDMAEGAYMFRVLRKPRYLSALKGGLSYHSQLTNEATFPVAPKGATKRL